MVFKKGREPDEAGAGAPPLPSGRRVAPTPLPGPAQHWLVRKHNGANWSNSGNKSRYADG